MNDDYLWDRSGPPDPEIERLEHTLAPLALRAAHAPVPRSAWYRYAAAAAVVIAAIGVARLAIPRSEITVWNIAGVAVTRGQVVRTTAAPVQLESDSVGRVDLAPGSELQASGGKRLALRRGELRAFIWAPAREFVVDTPSARTVDLGCQYTLTVDPSGDGLVRVSMGWVAFENRGAESFIPAGAQCRTRKSTGPGIPSYEDSTPSFRNALTALEDNRPNALDAVLREAGPKDGLSLWHLLTRVRQPERARVFDRFAQLVAVPAGVTRESVVRGDAVALDRCWDALGLENTSWWRGWERRW